MDPLALPWRSRLEEVGVFAVFAGLAIGAAAFVYGSTNADDAPIIPTTGRVTGFGSVVEKAPSTTGAGPGMLVDFRLSDGRLWSRRIAVDEASRCRVGQTVRLGVVKTRAGGERVLVPPEPCSGR